MSFTHADYLAMQARCDGARKNIVRNLGDPANREVGKGGLHEQIINHCNAQWPRWKFIHSRTDRRSTVEVGSQDFTIFMPGGKLLCVECKAKDKKLTSEQMAWWKEMDMLEHRVHLVYSLDEFIELANLCSNSNT